MMRATNEEGRLAPGDAAVVQVKAQEIELSLWSSPTASDTFPSPNSADDLLKCPPSPALAIGGPTNKICDSTTIFTIPIAEEGKKEEKWVDKLPDVWIWWRKRPSPKITFIAVFLCAPFILFVLMIYFYYVLEDND